MVSDINPQHLLENVISFLKNSQKGIRLVKCCINFNLLERYIRYIL